MKMNIKGRWIGWIFGLLVLGNGLELSAQTKATSADSVSIFRLMEEVEKVTHYRIYTTIPETFLVKKQTGATSLEQL